MRGKKAHRASGGKTWYAGGGSETAKESEDKSDDFKRGGKAVKVSGAKGHKRLDKRARGGSVGRSLSSAAKLSQPKGGAPAGNDEKPSADDEGD